MSKAALSVFVFGVYLAVISLGFLLIPNIILGMFGIPATTEPWIRVMAVILLILSYYLIQTARNELTYFFRLTVHGRASMFVFIAAFVILGLAPPVLILFTVVDLMAAIWTALALRAS